MTEFSFASSAKPKQTRLAAASAGPDPGAAPGQVEPEREQREERGQQLRSPAGHVRHRLGVHRVGGEEEGGGRAEGQVGDGGQQHGGHQGGVRGVQADVHQVVSDGVLAAPRAQSIA